MEALLFYQEFCDSAKTKPTGNVVVVYPGTEHSIGGRVVYEGLGRCFPNLLQDVMTPVLPDQPVTNWKVDPVWLEQYCLPITEAQARHVHPYLFFSCLDADLHEQRKTDRERIVWLCAVPLGLFVASSVVRILVNRNSS